MPDVFISFAHDDNLPLDDRAGKKPEGWVDLFERYLNTKLRERGLKGIRIWRDPQIQPGADWDQTILDKVRQVEVLVPVLSPPFAESAYCWKEVQAFWEAAKTRDRFKVEGRYCFFPVIKLPVDQAGTEAAPLLAELLKAQAVEIYVRDTVTGKPKSFRLLRDEELDLFVNKIEDVAIAIKEVFQLIASSNYAATSAPDRPTIYLAEVSSDLRDQRQTIWRELVERGYKVLPNEPLPRQAGEFERTVAERLQNCLISIHLAGSNYEPVLAADGRSAVEIQHDLAAQRGLASDLFRFIWLPRGVQPSGRQAEFVDRLYKELTGRAAILTGTAENLIEELLDKLNEIRQPAVYLAEGASDVSEDRQVLKQTLLSRGYRVLPDHPLTCHNRSELAAEIEGHLAQCQLSIHMLGEKYGLIPEDEARSLAHIQYDAATPRTGLPGQATALAHPAQTLRRIVWIKSETHAQSRQLDFINHLREEAPVANGQTRVVERPLSELKEVVLQTLAELKGRKGAGVEAVPRRKIYLIYDVADVQAEVAPNHDAGPLPISPGQSRTPVLELIDSLYKKGFDLLQPDFDAEEAYRLQTHAKNLCECDAAVIYWGKGSRNFVEHSLEELQRAAAYGRTKPAAPQTVLIGAPTHTNKLTFRNHLAQSVIVSTGEFSPECLSEFLALLAPSGGRANSLP